MFNPQTPFNSSILSPISSFDKACSSFLSLHNQFPNRWKLENIFKIPLLDVLFFQLTKWKFTSPFAESHKKKKKKKFGAFSVYLWYWLECEPMTQSMYKCFDKVLLINNSFSFFWNVPFLPSCCKYSSSRCQPSKKELFSWCPENPKPISVI